MDYSIIRKIIDQEGTSFYRIDHKWQPKGLMPDPYRRNLLKTLQARLIAMEDAEDEFQTLDRAPLYIRMLNRMRISARQAQFTWRSDDLAFLRSITRFFVDYGVVLQNLKIDQARGRFSIQRLPDQSGLDITGV